MTAIAVGFGLIAGLLHIGFWVIEAVWWNRPKIWRSFGVESQEQAETQAFGMLNQGYYNLFLGIGAVVGSVLVATRGTGRTVLLGYCCLFMLGAAVVLVVARRTMLRAALIQGVPPAVALAALAFI